MIKKEQLFDFKKKIPIVTKNKIDRFGLYKEMKEAEEPIIILHAGIGFGKTTLLNEFINGTDNICIWYSLQKKENNTIPFLYYFPNEIDNSNLDLLLYKYKNFEQEMEEKETYRIINYFLMQLENVSENTIFLIFDNFETVDNIEIIKLICNIVENIKVNIKIILAIKTALPSFLAKYILHSKVKIIEYKQMLFSKEELYKLSDEILKNKLDVKCLDDIYEYTQGWPVGVVSILLKVKQEISTSKTDISLYYKNAFITNTNSIYNNIKKKEYITEIAEKSILYEYIEYEIFKKFSLEIQNFLVESSVLDNLDIELCNYVLSISNTDSILKYLIKENFFIVDISYKKLQYPMVLKDFLKKKLTREKREQLYKKVDSFVQQNIIISCFGEFEIYIGTSKNKLCWRTKKAKEVCAYFFCKQGIGVEKEQIIEELWPDIPEKKGTALFHTTLSYVRKAFLKYGYSELIECVDKKYYMNMKQVKSELEEFIEIIMQMNENIEKYIQKKDRLLEIYRGAYMQEQKYYWILPETEQYERWFLKTCKKIETYYFLKKNYEEAITILKYMLTINPYDERNIIELLRIYALLQNKKDMKIQYEYYKKLFWEELNLELSKEVKAVYQWAIKSDFGIYTAKHS